MHDLAYLNLLIINTMDWLVKS